MQITFIVFHIYLILTLFYFIRLACSSWRESSELKVSSSASGHNKCAQNRKLKTIGISFRQRYEILSCHFEEENIRFSLKLNLNFLGELGSPGGNAH